MKLLQMKEAITQLPFRQFVRNNIFGEYTMADIDGDVLATMMAICPGDHLEIGVLHGGSAILCAYAKKQFKQEGSIYGMDPFPGFTPERTPVPPPPTIEAARANAELHGFQDEITFYQGYHPPLPAELENMRFATCFIDGDHTFECALADWLNVKDRVDGIIAFHDVHNPKHGANTVFEMACRDDDWEFYFKAGKMGVVIRKGYQPESYESVLERIGIEVPDELQGQAEEKPE